MCMVTKPILMFVQLPEQHNGAKSKQHEDQAYMPVGLMGIKGVQRNKESNSSIVNASPATAQRFYMIIACATYATISQSVTNHWTNASTFLRKHTPACCVQCCAPCSQLPNIKNTCYHILLENSASARLAQHARTHLFTFCMAPSAFCHSGMSSI